MFAEVVLVEFDLALLVVLVFILLIELGLQKFECVLVNKFDVFLFSFLGFEQEKDLAPLCENFPYVLALEISAWILIYKIKLESLVNEDIDEVKLSWGEIDLFSIKTVSFKNLCKDVTEGLEDGRFDSVDALAAVDIERQLFCSFEFLINVKETEVLFQGLSFQQKAVLDINDTGNRS